MFWNCSIFSGNFHIIKYNILHYWTDFRFFYLIFILRILIEKNKEHKFKQFISNITYKDSKKEDKKGKNVENAES